MVPPILRMYQSLQVLQDLFVCPSSKIIPLAPIHSFTRQIRSTFIVSTLIDLDFIKISLLLFHIVPYKVIHSTKIFLQVH